MPPAEAPSLPRTGTPHAERQPSARRTVVIRGQVAPPPRPAALAGPARRRPPRRASERIAGARPDRAALWAVLMGVFLILVAVMTGT
ncbi:MAG TPA: hypothetical protein VK506_00650 [Conexibacter sp.]|nr:hypothetical protein [Conexibacter sp.]